MKSVPKAAKILLLDTGKEWGGGTNSLLTLLRHIDRQQFDVHCVFYHDYPKGQDSCLSRELAALNIPLEVLPPLPQPSWAKWSKELVRGVLKFWPHLRRWAVDKIEQRWRIEPRARQIEASLRRGEFDLLYMNNHPESNREGFLAAKRAHLPVIQHCRTTPLLSPQASKLANGAAAIIAVSPSAAAALNLQGVNTPPIRVIFDGIDVHQRLLSQSEARHQLNIPAHEQLAVVVGSLLARKGVHDIIQALLDMPDWTLAVVGEGQQAARLKQQAMALGVSEQIRWVGFSSTPLLWMTAADVLISASESEGLGLVLMEAMLCARPVLASNVAGACDVVVNGETGVLFPYGDVPALVAAWQSLAARPTWRLALGDAGRRRALLSFSIEQYVSGVDAVWRQVLGLDRT